MTLDFDYQSSRRLILAAYLALTAIFLCLAVLTLLPSAVLFDFLSAHFSDKSSLTLNALLRFRAFCALSLAVVIFALGIMLRRSRLEWATILTARLAGLAADTRNTLSDFRGAWATEPKLPLLLIIAFGLAIRLYYLSVGMHHDESATFLLYASRPLLGFVTHVTLPNNQLLHTVLVHFSFLLFGDSPEALRLPALLFGVLVIPFSYIMARVLVPGGRAPALLTAAFVAGSSELIDYSVRARGYSMMGVSFLGALALGIRAVKTGRRADWLGSAFLVCLGFWVSPAMLYPLMALLCLLLLECVRERKLTIRELRFPGAAFAMAGLASCLAYLPSLIVIGSDIKGVLQFAAPIPLAKYVTEIPSFLGALWLSIHRDIPFSLALLLDVGLLIAAARNRRIPAVFLAFGACALLIFCQRVFPFTRVWQFLIPLYALGCFAWVKKAPDAVAVCLAAVLCAHCAYENTVPFDNEDPSIQDLGPIIEALRGDLADTRTALLSPFPFNVMVNYNILRARLHLHPSAFNPESFEGKNRLFLIVPRQYNGEEIDTFSLADIPTNFKLTEKRTSWPHTSIYVYRAVP